ncbi:MAG: Fe2+-dependent dioxygenase [Gammaproteobacteria bacterium]|nr:Fe2+-dependent dioxygenase [Gammaproteobacteria bacterium]
MLLEIPQLLNQAQLEKMREMLQPARFVDGRLTAGRVASQVKHNEELAQEPEVLQRLYRIVMASVGHSEVFRSAVLPAKVADFIFARYQPGMRYGDHVDDPIMGQGPRFRTDVSMTIFLNEPGAYEGGELVIRTPFGEQRVKLPAGHAVVYPSASVHRVAEVTRGERLVALTWIQSFVRDAARRELLYELDQSRQHLLKTDPESDVTKNIDRSYVNLLRMWAEL